MKINYSDTLKSIFIHLGLLEGKPCVDLDLLEKAANWALNTEGYQLKIYQPFVLQPILETLKGQKAKHFLPPLPLALSATLFPQPKPPTSAELNTQYNSLKSVLKNADEQHLLDVLSIHASSLAVNEQYNDLSLFDFIKMTTGIALCLNAGDSEICLAGGSISGIQSYLYDIVSKNAARLLKGRSFYLQLLADSLLAETIEQFDLSPCHVVYSSGGGFYVLMPTNATTKEGKSFDAFAKEMSSKIYKEHRFALFFEMAKTESFDKNLTIGNGKNAWDELFLALNKKKFKRLNANDEIKADFFKDYIEAGGTKTSDRDHITNEEFKETETPKYLYGNKETPVSTFTKRQIKLGGDLRRSVLYETSKNLSDSTLTDPIGYKHRFWENTQAAKGLGLKTFNDFSNSKYATILYGGNKVPYFKSDIEAQLANINESELTPKMQGDSDDLYKKGDIKPFEYLVGDGRLSRLATLRMDVDGLGAIFSKDIGVNQGRTNICRYATASRSLDFFFKGYLNTLREKYDDTVVIIYSGGDDLFIIGKWNDVFSLTEEINDAFKLWSCNNLTISGGVILLPPKFPIMQSARLAGDVEKKAKAHQFPVHTEGTPIFEKNAVCLFDTPLNWQEEYPIVKELYKDILRMIKSGSLSMSFINKIMAFAETQKMHSQFLTIQKKRKEGKEKELTKDEKQKFEDFKNMNLARWQWNMAYDLTRFADNSSSTRDKEAKDFVRLVMTNAFANSYNNSSLTLKTEYHFLHLLQVACRWAELEKRMDEQ